MGHTTTRPVLRATAWVFLAMVASPACESQKSNISTIDPWTAKPRDPKQDPVVATVNGDSIHVSDVKRQAELTGVSAKVALDALIDLEVLADRARELKFPPNADTLRAQKKAMVDVYLKREFEPTIVFEKLQDDDLRPIYERARSVFVRPRAVRILDIVVNAGPRFKREFDEARSLMREFVTTLNRKKNWSAEELTELASSQKWKEKGLKPMSVIQQPSGPYDGDAGEILLALKRVGEFTPIFENRVGVHIAMCTEIFEAKNVTFEQMRDEIRTTYFPRWQKERFLSLADKLANRMGVSVNEQALSKLDEK